MHSGALKRSRRASRCWSERRSLARAPAAGHAVSQPAGGEGTPPALHPACRRVVQGTEVEGDHVADEPTGLFVLDVRAFFLHSISRRRHNVAAPDARFA